MGRLPNGVSWHAWAVVCGVPATVGAFAIHPALAMVTGIGAFLSWRHGSDLEAQARAILLEEELQRSRESREQAIAKKWQEWDSAWEAAERDLEEGRITEAEHELITDRLLDDTLGEDGAVRT